MFGAIQEIFGTISVGILTVYLGFYLHYYAKSTFILEECEKISLANYYRDKLKKINTANTTLALMFFVLVYALGILTESVTGNLDDTNIPKTYSPCYEKKILGSDEDFRFDVLFEKVKDTIIKYKYTFLGEYVFSHKDIVINILKVNNLDYSESIDSLINEQFKSENPQKKTKDAVNAIYYKSKNWCYSQVPNHFQELEMIQNRIEFSRSIGLVIMFLIWPLILLTLWQGIRILIINRNLSEMKFGRLNDDDYINSQLKKLEYLNWLSKKNIILIVFLIGLFFLAKTGYRVTEQNFDERVFGYYFSYIDDEQFEKKSTKILNGH